MWFRKKVHKYTNLAIKHMKQHRFHLQCHFFHLNCHFFLLYSLSYSYIELELSLKIQSFFIIQWFLLKVSTTPNVEPINRTGWISSSILRNLKIINFYLSKFTITTLKIDFFSRMVVCIAVGGFCFGTLLVVTLVDVSFKIGPVSEFFQDSSSLSFFEGGTYELLQSRFLKWMTKFWKTLTVKNKFTFDEDEIVLVIDHLEIFLFRFKFFWLYEIFFCDLNFYIFFSNLIKIFYDHGAGMRTKMGFSWTILFPGCQIRHNLFTSELKL